MAESMFVRLWNAVKPPSEATRPGVPRVRLRREQRTLIMVGSGVLLAGVAAWGVYTYIASAPQRAQKEYDAAQKLMVPGDYAKATAGFTRAIAILPTMAEAYFGRGQAYHGAGDDEKALADFDQAIALDAGFAAAFAARASIYRSRGRIDQALDEYGKSIQAKPNVDAYFERGQLYETLGQHQKAIADYDQAIVYERDAPHLYRARAFAKANLGDEQGADTDRGMARSLEHQ